MNLDLLFLFIFAIILVIIMFINKKKVKIEKILFPVLYLIMYRTKFGLKFMDNFAKKYPKFLRVVGIIFIIIGFLGMLSIFVLLIYNLYIIFTRPEITAGVDILLPGRRISGLPYLSFWHWIIAIFILAIVHETSHGIFARLHDIKLKSSGFAIFSVLLPFLPAAFVEPDEKQLAKKSKKAQLSVLSAGSASNFIVALVFGLIYLFLFNPIPGSYIEDKGVVLAGFEPGYPAENAGIKIGEIIKEVDGVQVTDSKSFLEIMKNIKVGEKVVIKTDKGEYNIITDKHPEDSGKGYLGIKVSDYQAIKDIFSAKLFFWFRLGIFWIFFINLMVGWFNLLPFWVLDGGRIFYLALLYLTKNPKRSMFLFKVVNLVCLFLILINFWPKFRSLLSLIF